MGILKKQIVSQASMHLCIRFKTENKIIESSCHGGYNRAREVERCAGVDAMKQIESYGD